MSSTKDPLFIVGCPRSGTGLLHQLVRLHPDVAWVTPLSSWICGKSWFRSVPHRLIYGLDHVREVLPDALLPRFIRGPHDGSLQVPRTLETNEGHSFWNRHCPTTPHHDLTASDVTPDARRDFQDIAHWHRKYHQRPRFVSKTPRNALRMPFLYEIFPDATFIHLIRDGRAAAASILGRREASRTPPDQWWGARPKGWEDVINEPPIVQAVWTWKTILERVEHSTRQWPDATVHTVYYESLTRTPSQTLRRLFDAVDLEPDDFFGTAAENQLQKIRPPSASWKHRLSEEQKRHFDRIEPLLRAHGYTDDTS